MSIGRLERAAQDRVIALFLHPSLPRFDSATTVLVGKFEEPPRRFTVGLGHPQRLQDTRQDGRHPAVQPSRGQV